MTWNKWYSFKSYIRSSLWVVPVIALLIELVGSRLSEWGSDYLRATGHLDESIVWLSLAVPGATSLLQTIITLNISFLVFTFGSLLVAIQVASGQYTPRIISTTLLKDNAIRYSVGCFVFTLLFSVRTLNQMEQKVHQLNTFISGFFGAVSIVVFLYLIDYAARMLRPVSIVRRIGEEGISVVRSVYPLTSKGPTHTGRRRMAMPGRIVNHIGSSGIVLAVNVDELITRAHRADCVIEFVPQVGDFVAANEPLFRLYGANDSIDERALRSAVAFGPERTLEQDPTFAFRILVDIAIKALSPAINDPTTATLAIDQLHRLLFMVGSRHLRGEELEDMGGNLRVVFRTPNWEDFAHLAFTEIRHYGAGSVQVARRLLSMGQHLLQTLPEHRHEALRLELNLLDRAVELHYVFPEDIALARIPDAQGLGSRYAETASAVVGPGGQTK